MIAGRASLRSLGGPCGRSRCTHAWDQGLATHAAATGFWALVYEAWLRSGRRSSVDVLGKAAAMAGVSALVDYRATPKRFTPGWEFVFSPDAMAVAYAALAAGLAAGAGHRRGDVR